MSVRKSVEDARQNEYKKKPDTSEYIFTSQIGKEKSSNNFLVKMIKKIQVIASSNNVANTTLFLQSARKGVSNKE
ncbi:MAG: hypothetical protein KAY50_01425 [Chitinophagaceae bacterium]|nr:hypothetical protein [Chitinophagaceae bacterium]